MARSVWPAARISVARAMMSSRRWSSALRVGGSKPASTNHRIIVVSLICRRCAMAETLPPFAISACV